MGMEPEDHQHPSEDYLRRWVGSGLTGCGFAKGIARKAGRVATLSWVDEPTEELLGILDPFLEQSCIEGRFPFVLLPRVRDGIGIVQLLALLRDAPRWEVAPTPWSHRAPERRDVAISVHWKTPGLMRAVAMGFAPLGSMPVTRRAPYVALSLWPGGRDNPHFTKSPGDLVSFADAPTNLSKDAHDKLWETTARETRTMLGDPFDDVVWLRRVTFCLPESDTTDLFPAQAP